MCAFRLVALATRLPRDLSSLRLVSIATRLSRVLSLLPLVLLASPLVDSSWEHSTADNFPIIPDFLQLITCRNILNTSSQMLYMTFYCRNGSSVFCMHKVNVIPSEFINEIGCIAVNFHPLNWKVFLNQAGMQFFLRYIDLLLSRINYTLKGL